MPTITSQDFVSNWKRAEAQRKVARMNKKPTIKKVVKEMLTGKDEPAAEEDQLPPLAAEV